MIINDKVCLITGASKGLGRLIAIDMIKKGYNLLITGRNIERLKKVEEECLEINPEKIMAVACDFKEIENIDNIFDSIMCKWGRLDILINNAAVGYSTTFYSGKYEQWEEMLKINTLVPCIMMQKAINMFKKDSGSQIINISSTSAWRISRGGTFYPATKYALRALSEAIRKELVESGSDIRVSCISPGRMTTSFFSDSNLDLRKENQDHNLLEPEDLLKTINFILESPKEIAIQDIILRTTKQYE
jgi:NADP-dependent 3-hydroxy acid dehydrogenase YdfG